MTPNLYMRIVTGLNQRAEIVELLKELVLLTRYITVEPTGYNANKPVYMRRFTPVQSHEACGMRAVLVRRSRV